VAHETRFLPALHVFPHLGVLLFTASTVSCRAFIAPSRIDDYFTFKYSILNVPFEALPSGWRPFTPIGFPKRRKCGKLPTRSIVTSRPSVSTALRLTKAVFVEELLLVFLGQRTDIIWEALSLLSS
jgi:hypothetical protein